MPAIRLVVLALIAINVAACASGSRDVTGTVGPAPGSAPGGPGNHVVLTPSPGFLGSRIGAALDDEDRRRAFAAQTQALETGPSGAPVAWRNPDSGRYGNVVPGPAYQISGANCRQFTHTVYLDEKPQVDRGTACRNPDGTWTNVN